MTTRAAVLTQLRHEVIRSRLDPGPLMAYGWPADLTSKIPVLMTYAHPYVNKGGLPRDGIGVLTRRLGSLLPVQNLTTVRYITPPDATGRHTVHYLTPELERRSVTPDVVVLAVEGKYLDKLVQGLTPKQRVFAESIYFTKEAIVCYMLDPKHAPQEYRGGAGTRLQYLRRPARSV